MLAALIRTTLVLVYAIGLAGFVGLVYVASSFGSGVAGTLIGTVAWMMLVSPLYWAHSRLWERLDRLELWGR